MHATHRALTLVAFTLPLFTSASIAAAQSFSVPWSTIDGGGGSGTGVTPSGVSFTLYASIGQHDAGTPGTGVAGSGAAFVLAGGFLARGPAAPPPTCPADFNADGELNADDLSDYITCFFTNASFPGACTQADFNTDGEVNADDLSDYITAFFTGCP